MTLTKNHIPMTEIHVVGCSDISHGAISVSFVADVVFVYTVHTKSKAEINLTT